MVLFSDQNIVVSQSNGDYVQPVDLEDQVGKPEGSRPINYLKLIPNCGIKAGNKILIIGGGNFELIAKMARVVGHRGSITILGWDSESLEIARKGIAEKSFTALKPLVDFDPALDFRTPAEKYQPIRIVIEEIQQFDMLPFATQQFDFVWVDQSPLLTRQQNDSFLPELARVASAQIKWQPQP